jgi:glycerol uptake facilitator-like aquaporin
VNFTSWQRLSAELMGTAGIVAVVLGTSHMAASLEAAPAIDLIMNALATAGVLFVLISLFGSISGAHFNPVVTLALFIRKEINVSVAVSYSVAQIAGAALGAVLANLMFTDQAIALSSTERAGTAVFLGEVIASFGLVFLILVLAQQGKATLDFGRILLYRFNLLRQPSGDNWPGILGCRKLNCLEFCPNVHRSTSHRSTASRWCCFASQI